MFTIRMSSLQTRLEVAVRAGLLGSLSQSAIIPPISSAISSSSSSFSTSQPIEIPNATTSIAASVSGQVVSPPSAPSLVMKAYALALKSRVSLDTDLSLTGQAVFVANIQNRGIPLNTAKEYANEALYHHANSIQDGSQITIQSNRGDFFEYQNGYMLQVQDDELDGEKSTPEINAYTNLLRLTEKAFQRLLADYKGIKASDPAYKWQDHVDGPEGVEYRRYWAKRDEASSKLPDSAVVMALKIFDSSHARAESKRSQNMPCVLGDVDLGSSTRFTVDPKDIIYRPAYSLPGFVSTATFWRDNYMNVKDNPEELVLDLRAAFETPWRELGFPEFPESSMTRDQLESLKDYRVSLSFTGMMPFRITRGLWNIEDFREFTVLKPDAPARFKTPTFRTDMLLMGYGMQMKISIPGLTDKPTAILPELLSGVTLSNKGNGVWMSDTPSNDAYPTLLAVLASKR